MRPPVTSPRRHRELSPEPWNFVALPSSQESPSTQNRSVPLRKHKSRHPAQSPTRANGADVHHSEGPGWGTRGVSLHTPAGGADACDGTSVKSPSQEPVRRATSCISNVWNAHTQNVDARWPGARGRGRAGRGGGTGHTSTLPFGGDDNVACKLRCGDGRTTRRRD